MTDIDDTATPELVPGVDPQNLDIEPSPEEYFVLSRVDGSMTIEEIQKTCGLGAAKTEECIQNLREYGLIQLPGDDGADQSADSATDSDVETRSGDRRNRQTAESSTDDDQAEKTSDDLGEEIRQRFPADFGDYGFDEQLLSQTVELDDDFKREVIFVYEQLEDVDHYQLLGVDRGLEGNLRKAYFRMSKRYHPDRFYQKILGDFESMIEDVFQRITRAYQTLTNDRKRKEYDESLQQGGSPDEQASTPASQRSEPRESMKDDQKKDQAFNVLVQRSDTALEEDRVSEAVEGYRKALSLKRDADLALRVARRLLEADEHLDDATSFARAARKIDDSSAEALELIGRIYERKDSPDDAIYHYEMAIEAGADAPELRERIDRLEG